MVAVGLGPCREHVALRRDPGKFLTLDCAAEVERCQVDSGHAGSGIYGVDCAGPIVSRNLIQDRGASSTVERTAGFENAGSVIRAGDKALPVEKIVRCWDRV